MLSLRHWEWLDARPLWQYVLINLAVSTVILLVVGELLYRIANNHFDRLGPVFFVIWFAFMTPVYIWQGKRRNS